MRVLCLDIEGGFGGSSRSLYQSLKHMDRSAVDLNVWCKRQGPIQDRYREIGIDASVQPGMPKVSSLPLFSRNLAVYGRFALDWLAAGSFRAAFYDALDGVDLVHFNHEALFWLARDMRRRKPKPATMHIRTNLWPSAFATAQCRLIERHTDNRIFITENERETLSRHAGHEVAGEVLFNIVEPQAAPAEPWETPAAFRDGKSLLIGCLSNYSWLRGTDRLIELAAELRRAGRTDIGFVVAGKTELTPSMPEPLGRIARAGGDLTAYAAEAGVADMFLFTGHVQEPERILALVDTVIKPTREANPWGRDILEAMAAGKPVISTGTYDRFVETDATGILQPDWDAADLARRLIDLAEDRNRLTVLGQAARDRVAKLCDGPSQSRKLLEIWQRAAGAR